MARKAAEFSSYPNKKMKNLTSLIVSCIRGHGEHTSNFASSLLPRITSRDGTFRYISLDFLFLLVPLEFSSEERGKITEKNDKIKSMIKKAAEECKPTLEHYEFFQTTAS